MDERILVLAPLGRDASVTRSLLQRNGLLAEVCDDIPGLIAQIRIGAGAALITEEAFASTRTPDLLDWVAGQPRWSDFPFVVPMESSKRWAISCCSTGRCRSRPC
jgi:hypothetical protein